MRKIILASFSCVLCLFLFSLVSRRENKLTAKSGKQQQAEAEAQKLENTAGF